jgi:Ca-activated chloride channel family protein
MVFAHPWLLLLLLLLPLLAWLKGKRGIPPAFVYSSVQLVRGMQNITRSRAGGFLMSLRWLVLAIFIVALAQPRLTKSTTSVKASGVDIVVVFDMSLSMLSEDFVVKDGRVSRYDMARSVLKKFIDERPNDRIGLVVFATQAFIATPLSLDHDFLQENLDRLEITSINPASTAIGDALSTAVNRLRDLKSKSKIVILMTDGQNNSGKIPPLIAAEAAHALGIKIYTIGIGEQGTAPMPAMDENFNYILDPFGRKQYQMQKVDVDEDTLQKIAQMTGGKYYRADNSDKFQQIYAEIDKLEKTEATVSKYTEFKELFPWLVAGGLALLLLEIVLGQTAFRRLP